MFRPICSLFVILAIAPLAWACDCSSTGGCHCGTGTCVCGQASSPPPAPAEPQGDPGSSLTVNVAVANFSFTPANITITAGDTVEWDFLSGNHNAKSVVGAIDPFESPFFTSGVYSRQFNIPGTISYYCVPHGFDNFNGTAGGMAGTITVLPAPEPVTLSLALIVPVAMMLRRRRATHSSPGTPGEAG